MVRLRACLWGALALGLAGCASVPRTPFTVDEAATAAPAGFQDVRYRQDDPALRTLLRQALAPSPGHPVEALALSGGGANGAYGAGLLSGWTRIGGRPVFQVVTGVSTGALTAPLAFIGSDEDEALRKAYTGPRVVHLLRGRGLLGLLTPGLYRRQPLVDLVRGYVTEELLRKVAAEHGKGRRLLVATTNLDTEQLIVWDMGAIAAHGGRAARDLFAEVLVASASVPGIFAPTLIKVTSGGRRFEEMHVDGQTESAFFAFPPPLLLATNLPEQPFKLRLYVVINGRTEGLFAVTPAATIPILSRSFDVASQSSIRSALISTAQFCRDRGCVLHVAALPAAQRDDPLDFSLAHEHSLFAAGEVAIATGEAWRDVAP